MDLKIEKLSKVALSVVVLMGTVLSLAFFCPQAKADVLSRLNSRYNFLLKEKDIYLKHRSSVERFIDVYEGYLDKIDNLLSANPKNRQELLKAKTEISKEINRAHKELSFVARQLASVRKQLVWVERQMVAYSSR